MQYVVYCQDKPGAERLRLDTRPAHLTYLGGFAERIRLAGPLMSDDGEHMIGSLILIDLDSLEAAETFSAEDPYTRAGLFQHVTIRPFRQTVPAADV